MVSVNLRCFIRPSSRLDRLEKALSRFDAGKNVELVTGDLLSHDDCRKAAKGVSIIYHLAAGMEKSFAGAFMNSALASRNLIDAFRRYGQPKRFVNVSSFAVYSTLSLKRGDVLDESCPLEDSPQERFDAYGFGKLKQEELVKEYGRKYELPYVIRPPRVRVRTRQARVKRPHWRWHVWVLYPGKRLAFFAIDLRR